MDLLRHGPLARKGRVRSTPKANRAACLPVANRRSAETQVRCLLASAVLLMLAACALPPPLAQPATLRVNLFRGSSNIPIYLAIEQGSFARRGITPLIEFTPNSEQQRAGLAAGRFDIAQAAVDNAVAMRELGGQDVVIVAGGDHGMNELVATPDIDRPADLRGHRYLVDAPNTAYALIGRKILKNAGLADGTDYQLQAVGGSETRAKAMGHTRGAATVVNPPWNFLALEGGARSLGSTADLFGPYQAQGLFVMRRWAIDHASALERFLAAYIEGCRIAQDPSQREFTLQVLTRELKLERRVAEMTYRELNAPRSGMSRDCAFDGQGFANVLGLRAEIEGQWGGKPPDPAQFLDLGYYDRAMRSLLR